MKVNSISLWVIAALYSFCAYAYYSDLAALSHEDGIVEYLSVLFWLVGLILAVNIIMRKKLNHNFIVIVFLAVCFLSLGEEISWGQRLLNIETPEFIASANRQSELNFHNLYALSGRSTWRHFFETGEFNYQQIVDAQNLFRLGFFGFFIFLPLLIKTTPGKKVLVALGYIPPAASFTTLLTVFILASFVVTIGMENQQIHYIQEIREMSYALFVALYLFQLFNHKQHTELPSGLPGCSE
jgi:hypothetical protein